MNRHHGRDRGDRGAPPALRGRGRPYSARTVYAQPARAQCGSAVYFGAGRFAMIWMSLPFGSAFATITCMACWVLCRRPASACAEPVAARFHELLAGLAACTLSLSPIEACHLVRCVVAVQRHGATSFLRCCLPAIRVEPPSRGSVARIEGQRARARAVPPTRCRGRHVATVALAASLWSMAASAQPPSDAAWNALQDGAIVLFRHANAPGGGDPPGLKIGDCSTQRNLDDSGRAQARRIGERFRDRRVRVGAVLTSQWCRTRETAELAFPGQARDDPNFNSFFGDSARARDADRPGEGDAEPLARPRRAGRDDAPGQHHRADRRLPRLGRRRRAAPAGRRHRSGRAAAAVARRSAVAEVEPRALDNRIGEPREASHREGRPRPLCRTATLRRSRRDLPVERRVVADRRHGARCPVSLTLTTPIVWMSRARSRVTDP